ncbi:hypothetical protein [Nocardiopsis sp. JB363]|uniref:hypothetical protein n=1 Tax=Nocardiopsis sp. JB363 TaxID=1434837 RepID=UPI00117E8077|nr:hypothetical protein [Nocardiopsis sp. JB363]
MRAAANRVAHREEQLQEAQALLRRAIAHAEGEVDAETILTEVEHHLPDEELVSYFADARILHRSIHGADHTAPPGEAKSKTSKTSRTPERTFTGRAQPASTSCRLAAD